MGRVRFYIGLLAVLLAMDAGCASLPSPVFKPSAHNPFAQLSRVAVAPFYNLSAEPSVDGRQFALAYFNELQSVPGFEVVPMGVVEEAARAHRLSLESAGDIRKLAEVLEVDAVVVGAITDFSPYYPPRCGMRVEWYAADPTLPPILPGHGLPWGTPEEGQIPDRLVYESKMAHERAGAARLAPSMGQPAPLPGEHDRDDNDNIDSDNGNGSGGGGDAPRLLSASNHPSKVLPADRIGTAATKRIIRSGPSPGARSLLCESYEPVMRHTAIYNGNDPHLTEALAGYVLFRDDARFGGWQSYLERSDDFTRFCCHMHIHEMLTARGGADETQVRWRWPSDR